MGLEALEILGRCKSSQKGNELIKVFVHMSEKIEQS